MKVAVVLFLSLLSVTSFAQDTRPISWMADHLEYDPDQSSPEDRAPRTIVKPVVYDSSPRNLLGEKVEVDNAYHGQAEKAAVKIHSTKSKQYNRRVEEKANNSNQGAGVNNN